MRKERITEDATMPLMSYDSLRVGDAAVLASFPRTGGRARARVYCTSCTRSVDAEVTVEPNVVYRKASLKVVAGQKCPRCSSSLDAAFVVAPNN